MYLYVPKFCIYVSTDFVLPINKIMNTKLGWPEARHIFESMARSPYRNYHQKNKEDMPCDYGLLHTSCVLHF